MEECQTNTIVDLEKTLKDYDRSEFYFYRENSMRSDARQSIAANQLEYFEFFYNYNCHLEYISKWRKTLLKLELKRQHLRLQENSTTCYEIPCENIVDCIIIEDNLKESKL